MHDDKTASDYNLEVCEFYLSFIFSFIILNASRQITSRLTGRIHLAFGSCPSRGSLKMG